MQTQGDLEIIKNELEALKVKVLSLESSLQQFFNKNNSSQSNVSLDLRDDELYKRAIEVVVTASSASASLLQRHLQIGYAKACLILDRLEKNEIVSLGKGASPRKVLVKSSKNIK